MSASHILIPNYRLEPLLWSNKWLGLFTRNFRNDHYTEITEGDFKGERAIISGDYKLVIDGTMNSGIELFNLRSDSAETKNIASP